MLQSAARIAAALVLWGSSILAPPLSAQIRVSPEIAYSRARDFGVGMRVSHPVFRDGWVFIEAMEFFPSSAGTADPGVGVDSDYRQIHAGMFFLGRRASLQPYAGGSAGWFMSSLTLERDGASGTADRAEFFVQVLAGMRLPRPRLTPYVEARRMFEETTPWVFAAGAELTLR